MKSRRRLQGHALARAAALVCCVCVCRALPLAAAEGQPLHHSPDAHAHGEAGHPHRHAAVGRSQASLRRQQQWVDAGEAALAQGRVDDASRAFEQAALMAHEAGIELGVLRTQMQAGAYRQALAFAAHTAGVHLDEVAGTVFYAWLLNLGGQQAIADDMLRRAEARAPGQALVLVVRSRFQSGQMQADGLLSPPMRLAPYPTGVQVPASAQVVCTATLLADGRHALMPRRALPRDRMPIWLRNGLGQAVAATVAEGGEGEPSLVLLRLSEPLPTAGGDVVAPRDAFAGSPAFVLSYQPAASATPGWPLIRAGFLGRAGPADAGGGVDLGVALHGDDARGGPVFDAAGRLIGVAVRATGTDGDKMVPVGTLRARFGERFGVPDAQVRPQAVPVDQLYERAMRTSLQVLTSTVE